LDFKKNIVILRGALEAKSQTLIILRMFQFINFMSFYFIFKYDIGLSIMANFFFKKCKISKSKTLTFMGIFLFEMLVHGFWCITQQHIIGFVTKFLNDFFFFTMFITIWSQKLLCTCKGHQDVVWYHGFVIIVNMTTCSIFG
jgi:hypothetical protein